MQSTIKVEPRVMVARPVRSYLMMNCSFKTTMERPTETMIAKAQLTARSDILRKGKQSMCRSNPTIIVTKPNKKRQEQ